jgi:hypothetical protein
MGIAFSCSLTSISVRGEARGAATIRTDPRLDKSQNRAVAKLLAIETRSAPILNQLWRDCNVRQYRKVTPIKRKLTVLLQVRLATEQRLNSHFRAQRT